MALICTCNFPKDWHTFPKIRCQDRQRKWQCDRKWPAPIWRKRRNQNKEEKNPHHFLYNFSCERQTEACLIFTTHITAHTETLRFVQSVTSSCGSAEAGMHCERRSVYLVEIVSILPQTEHLLFIWGRTALSRKLKLERNSDVRNTADQEVTSSHP